MGIQDLPPNSGFGLDFNYAVWEAGTTVTLARVPWDATYKDVVAFENQAAIDKYINDQAAPVFTNMSYHKATEPIRVDLPFNTVYQYNYLRVSQPLQPIEGDRIKTFFYFITDVRYIAPNTTEIVVQLDVWQSFSRNITMGNCYIERGHVGIANTHQFDNYGRDYLTIPEGLDIGGEYVIKARTNTSVGSLTPNTQNPAEDFQVDILVMSTVSWEFSGGTVENPVLKTAAGSDFENLPNGADLYLFDTPEDFRNAMATLANKPWITQGVISVTAIPHTPRQDLSFRTVSANGVTFKVLNSFRQKNVKKTLTSNWRKAYFGSGIISYRYRHLKKFFTYPYMLWELTTYSGTPLVLKPESMADDDFSVTEFRHLAPPGQRISWSPWRYNAETLDPQYMFGTSDDVRHDGGEFLDMTTGISNFPTFSVVNNGYMSFLASNANSIAYQHSSADWSKQKALSGAEASRSIGEQSANSSFMQNQRAIQGANQMNALNVETAGYRAIQGGVNGIAGGLTSGNPMGLIGGALGAANSAVGYGIDTNQMNKSTAISNAQSGDIASMSRGSAMFGVDTNNAYANMAARGDYQNAIAGINAKVQDARMVQPTTAGQIGGEAFNLTVLNGWHLYAFLKILTPAAMNAIGEYWLRYGYAINRFGRVPNNFQVMTKFTYWKTLETYISSAYCPEIFKQTLRGIFEKGVTVWNDPRDIGNIDLGDNEPLEGITL